MKKFLLASLLLLPFFGVQGQNLFDGVTITSNLTVQAGATVSGVGVVSNGVNGLTVTGANVGVSTNGATSGQVLTFVGGTSVAFATAASGSGMASNVVNNTTANQNSSTGTTNTINGDLNFPNSVSGGGEILKNNLLWMHNYGSTSNLFWGFNSGNTNANSTAIYSVGIGYGVLHSLLGGNYATVVGANSGTNITAGRFNTIVGASSGNQITTAEFNTIMGYGAGSANIGSSTMVGYQAGASAVAGNGGGVFIGYGSGPTGGSGANTIEIGFNTSGSPGAGSILIGQSSTTAGGTNVVVLGQGITCNTQNALILGNAGNLVGIGTVSPTVAFQQNGPQTIIGPQGTAYRSDISATAVLDFTSILALGTSQALTVSVTGASTNDVVEPGPPIDFTTALADSTFNYHVSAVNTVTVTRTGLAATAVYTNKTWRMTIKHY